MISFLVDVSTMNQIAEGQHAVLHELPEDTGVDLGIVIEESLIVEQADALDLLGEGVEGLDGMVMFLLLHGHLDGVLYR